MKCQSVMEPSSATYWHIGETTMRLGSVTPPSWIGVKSFAVMGAFYGAARSKPAPHGAAVLGIGGAEARPEDALLRPDLEAIEVGDEERRADECQRIGKPQRPSGEYQQIAEVHRVARKAIDAGDHELGGVLRSSRVRRRAGAPELHERDRAHQHADGG